MGALDVRQAAALVAALQGVDLPPAAAADVGRMLSAVLAAAEAARIAGGGSFFDTEPAGFLAALERHGSR